MGKGLYGEVALLPFIPLSSLALGNAWILIPLKRQIN